MCATCGCGKLDEPAGTRISAPAGTVPHEHEHEHEHEHGHEHGHSHEHGHGQEHVHAHPDDHGHAPTETLTLEQKILAKNDRLAEDNRAWLTDRRIAAINIMSSPGSGKTTLLERTVRELRPSVPVSVIEGDQETLLDADRIQATGCPVVQVNTGSGCHLDSEMVRDALDALGPAEDSLVFVENVGNLVCPALFDLGEQGKVVLISVTEGDDKPLKYPHIFAVADLVIVNKIDLLPYVDFDPDACEKNARSVNPDVRVINLSATSGEGLERWYAWLSDRRKE
ncbi:hydrogenase nickel incorporation protein HypB [Prescottella equi]|uniref:Hydrogenase nickel incorporation protein HypB n=1 Tax=Rhodococcus hoagii TaxID=43767 RepID=A0A9Q5RPR7_RHOHA|nr:hydrogenase nickel incorporation protein HypB [Prescottella equi]MBM4491202.1 hydrogenase nickel incorporation protein HypB [Prescottella equi]MBM4502155.1 hydrogenase nickel incorporation protein HypB [Prescottella equi]MBM4505922.1 hydrogenase nickel incorporation protein HypB [Prescottella equi]MBM4550483.1 hydrogenase nickel incorporation protein HypB [Prescottella equi]MBM4566360.1 hydrogenase nickel incorporation protein HypB [Prescottella equi]